MTTGVVETMAGLRPEHTDVVVDAVRAAHAARTPLRITGAGTWLNAGPPVHDTQPLSLASLRGIIAYVPGDLTITAWAGTTLAELSHETAAHGQWLGLDPAGSRQGTIGATIATASSGPLSHAFGTPRDLVLGLQVVTGSGEVLRPGGRVVKNVAGFDLVRLYTGSWGTLGAITAVTLRLRALPVHDVTYAISVTDTAQVPALFTALRSPALSLLALEWLDARAARAVGLDGTGDVVLVRSGGNAAFVAGQASVLRGLAPQATACDAAVWGRLAVLDAEAAVVARVSGAVASLPQRITGLREALQAAGANATLQARVHRGMVRVCCGTDTEAVRAVLQTAAAHDTCIVERQPAAWWATTPDAFATPLATRVREAFDPARICNRRRDDA